MGDWELTWTDEWSRSLWLRDFLPLTVPTARVWSYGYDSEVLSQSVNEIDLEARSLLDRIQGAREDSGTLQKPIIFIAHSLGGIIVKKVSEALKSRVHTVLLLIYHYIGVGAGSRDVRLLWIASESRSCHRVLRRTSWRCEHRCLGYFSQPRCGHDSSTRQSQIYSSTSAKFTRFPGDISPIHPSRFWYCHQNVLRDQKDRKPVGKLTLST
jgi:hypothetical protein